MSTDDAAPAEPLRGRTVAAADAVRMTLYLHPDDAAFLRYGLRARDAQAAIRAMIAAVRADAELRAIVEQIARDTPRTRTR